MSKLLFAQILFQFEQDDKWQKEVGMTFLRVPPFSYRIRSYTTPNRAKRCSKGLSLTEKSETIFTAKLFIAACCASVSPIREELSAKRFCTDPSQKPLPYRAYSADQQDNYITCMVV